MYLKKWKLEYNSAFKKLWEESESMNHRKQKNCPYNIVCTYVSKGRYRNWESLEDNATKYVLGMCTIRTAEVMNGQVLRNSEQCWSHSCVLDPRQQQIEDQVWADLEHIEHTALEHTEHTALEHTEHTALEHTRLTHVNSAESIYVGRLRASVVQQDP